MISELGHKPNSKNGQSIILQNEKDLGREDVKKLIAPLPESPSDMDRIAALCPSPEDEPLLPGQRWVLFDTGASCSALKVSRDCPDYADWVRPTSNSVKGKGAESANGGSILERGEVQVDMLIDDIPCKLKFRDMDVSMTISSGRECVASEDTFAVIRRNGGVLKNIATGKQIQLFARQGVYFFKGFILPPNSIPDDPSSPFVRRG